MTGKEVAKFLRDYGNGRIRQETINAYAAFEENQGGYLYLNHSYDQVLDAVVGITACIIVNRNALKSVTCVKQEYRRQGRGSLLQRAKLDYCRMMGIKIEATVAADNLASNMMVQRAGMVETRRSTNTRGPEHQQYEVIHYGQPELRQEETTPNLAPVKWRYYSAGVPELVERGGRIWGT